MKAIMEAEIKLIEESIGELKYRLKKGDVPYGDVNDEVIIRLLIQSSGRLKCIADIARSLS